MSSEPALSHSAADTHRARVIGYIGYTRGGIYELTWGGIRMSELRVGPVSQVCRSTQALGHRVKGGGGYRNVLD